MTKYENETIISFNEQEDTANIFSCSAAWMSKIKRVKGWRESGHGVEVDVPKSWIKFPTAPKKMNLSPEQRKALADRLAKTRNKK